MTQRKTRNSTRKRSPASPKQAGAGATAAPTPQGPKQKPRESGSFNHIALVGAILGVMFLVLVAALITVSLDSDEEQVLAVPQTQETGLCPAAEHLAITSADKWVELLESPPCNWEWTRSNGGGALLVRINGDDQTIREYLPGSPVYYTTPIWKVGFRLRSEVEEPTSVTVRYVPPGG